MTATDCTQAQALFDIDPALIVVPPPKLTGNARRTELQLEKLAAGYHPITGLRLHPEAAPVDDREAPGRRCGTCRFREVLGYHRKSYAKCMDPGTRGADEVDRFGTPFVTHGAGSDVRSWWPACVDHSYSDRALSDDAARCVPKAVDV